MDSVSGQQMFCCAHMIHDWDADGPRGLPKFSSNVQVHSVCMLEEAASWNGVLCLEVVTCYRLNLATCDGSACH